MQDKSEDFVFVSEQFADIRILRYQVPGFEKLSLRQKKLVYYLSRAALCGRDIIFDQNGKYNLKIRKTLEVLYTSFLGSRKTSFFRKFEEYLKRIWFSNGIYHHYSSEKILPGFPAAYFNELIYNCDKSRLPLEPGQTLERFIAEISPVIFDAAYLPMKVSKDPSKDLLLHSAVNFYENITETEASAYYESKKKQDDPRPVSYGLNSKLVKENGAIHEMVWKKGGLYSGAIEKIIHWLKKAATEAENEQQKETIAHLVKFYETGDLSDFDQYNILWVKDTASIVDFVNGFIETYEDPLGYKATWEANVNFIDEEATKRTEIISRHAAWFEAHSPVDERFRKKEVKGVSARVITVAQLGGECYPSTPIGINLPNADWIRKEHGSKSVSIENISYAYEQASLGTGFLEEFSSSGEEVQLIRKYGYQAGNLHTDLHECLGHGSGQLLPGVSADALKNYHSPLEEARADLYALYYMADPKILELGLLPDVAAARSEYIAYIRNGLFTQLTRIEPGKNIEQAHMRCRQMIASWCYEKGKPHKVIERIVRDGKSYFLVHDFERLRVLFAELLAEVQRIKSEGDYEAGRQLIETYGVKVNEALHLEVLERYRKLNLAPYSGFINPNYSLVQTGGEITDVAISYPGDYASQMLEYSEKYSYL